MGLNIFYFFPILLFGTIYIFRIISDITRERIKK